MKVKFDDYHCRVLINGLYNYHSCYDEDTNDFIDTLILRLADENKLIKTHRKRKFTFTSLEVSVIRQCLIDWRNEEIQNSNEVAVDVIGELLILF